MTMIRDENPEHNTMIRDENPEHKVCIACGERKPLTEFHRRTGRKSGAHSRRGTCRSCARQKTKPALVSTGAPARTPMERVRPRREKPIAHPVANPADASSLMATRNGLIRMRGRTDKGRRWHQEIDLELAVTLVKERAAVLVNRHTIRRLFSSKDFRRYILTRDKHTCHYCRRYGDTIDHLLPRAKGGHTTPDNCVCACMECNQSKADRDLEEFVGAGTRGSR